MNVPRYPAASLLLLVLLTLAPWGCGGAASSSVASSDDSDGDGLTDAEEVQGWPLLVDTSGLNDQPGLNVPTAQEARQVTSDPNNPDTDGDGLNDGDERLYHADPRSADTDTDSLTDVDEVRRYTSAPNAVDSDGDARSDANDGSPNVRLFDGAEVSRGASPVLRDTDGDGLSDYREILDGGSHPGVSNLPLLGLEVVGSPNVYLNAVQATETREGLSTVSASLRGVSSTSSSTDSTTNEVVLGFRESVSNETSTSVSVSPFEVGASASNTTTFEFEATQTFSQTSTHSTTHEAAQMAQQSYEEAINQENTRSVSYEDGTVRVALRVTNRSSSIAVHVSSVSVIAKRFDAASGAMVVLGELRPPVDAPIDDNIAAGDAIEVVFENTTIAPDDIKAVLADPRALSFQVGRYSLSRIDSSGQPTADYTALSEDMSRQCGLIVVDYGDGRVERFSVATNVSRDPDGRPAGLPLAEAMNLVGLGDGIETAPDPVDASRRILSRLGNRANALTPGPGRGFWTVLSNQPQADWSSLMLRQGERIIVAYLRDEDGDGLFNREEFIYGTDPNDPDTDHDGITDLNDRTPLGDDGPVLPDPDQERIPTAGLIAHWATGGSLAPMLADQSANGGHAATIRCDVDSETDRFDDFGGAWDFADHGPNERCYAEVEDLRIPAAFSMAVWLKRSTHQTSAGFVAGQWGRAWLTTAVGGNSQLQFVVGADSEDDAIRVSYPSDGLDDWTFVVATLGPDGDGLRLKLYVDGALVDDAIAPTSALDDRLDITACPDTFYFGGADWPCRSNRTEFSGAVDDLRLYDRALTGAEVRALMAELP